MGYNNSSRRRTSVFIIILIFAVLISMRAVHLVADSPKNLSKSGGIFGDEGWEAHNARNKVLFGNWKYDDYMLMYVSPIINYALYLSFRVMGVGLRQTRYVALFFSLLTLLFFYLAIKDEFGRGRAAFCTLILGVNYIFIMYNRLSIMETEAVFFIVLSMFLFQKGLRDRFFLFLCGVSGFVAFISKSIAIFALITPILVLLWYLIREFVERKEEEGERVFPLNPLVILRAIFHPSMLSLLAGMLVTFLIWYYPFFSKHVAEIAPYTAYTKGLLFPYSFRKLVSNIASHPLIEYFYKSPITLFATFIACFSIIYLLLKDWRNTNPLIFFAFWWLIIGGLSYSAFSYRPLRYYILLTPPLCFLGASALLGIRDFKAKEKLKMTPLFFIIFFILLFIILIPPARILLLRLSSPVISTEAEEFSLALKASLLSLAFTLFVVLVILALRGKVFALSTRRPRFFYYLFILLVTVALVINASQYLLWAAFPQYKIYTISKDLGEELDNAVIAGSWSMVISLENEHHALPIWMNHSNYKDPFHKYKITHLFLTEYNDEPGLYKEWFPEEMRHVEVIKEYDIGMTRVKLYKVNIDYNL